MLARRLTTILPAMTLAEAIETTRIHSVAGLTGERTAVTLGAWVGLPYDPITAAAVSGGGMVMRRYFL
jgi:magnesium chelatase family protein